MRKLYLHLAVFSAAVFFGKPIAIAATGPFALLHSIFNPSTNTQTRTQHGYSVAVDGGIAVVGSPLDLSGGLGSGVVKIYNVADGTLMHTLTNPSSTGGNYFGRSVGISGLKVVVGHPFDSKGAQESGSAYVYDLAGASPTIPVMTLASPEPKEESQFGCSVAMSGNRIVVGARHERIGDEVTSAGGAYVFDLANATPYVPVARLRNTNPQHYALFGSSVAISGSRVVVAAPLGEGGIFVYDLAGIAAITPLIISSPDDEGSDFGLAVGISGTRVVAGAKIDYPWVENVGIAYVFDLTNALPTVPVIELYNPVQREEDSYGSAIAIAGNRVVVGGLRQSTAYVYNLAGSQPMMPAVTLTNPAPVFSEFGASVALSGDKAIVGAPLDDNYAPGGGAAYVYNLGGGNPALPSAKLDSPSPSSEGYFGAAVAVSGTRMVIGARHEGGGAAFVYDLGGAAPTVPVVELRNPRTHQTGAFGISVAISGTKVVIGDSGFDMSAGFFGGAFVYDLTSPTPSVPVITLTNLSIDGWNFFGSTVAISGTRVVVGSIGEDSGAVDAGSVFVFDLASSTPTVPVVTLNNPSPALQDYFGGAVAILGTRVIVGVSGDDHGAMDSGIAYLYDLAGATPNLPWTTLTNPAPSMFNYFGSAVAISGTRAVVGARGAWKAYVYEFASATPSVPVVTLNESAPGAYCSFGSAVSISSNLVVVGSEWKDAGVVGAGSAYVFNLSNPTPTAPIGILLNPSPFTYDWFGSSVAIDGTTIVAGAYGDNTVAADRGAAYVFGPWPSLSITPAAPGLATLSWTPATSSGFVLQYADRLTPTNWFAAQSGVTNPVTIPLINAARFHRLIQQ